MTTIGRRKAMTVDALRERTRKAMAKSHTRDCATCGGSGRVTGPLTTADVVAEADIAASALYAFLAKNKGLSLEAGLKLLAYLERLDDPLSELDDDERDPDERERESARRRLLSEASAKAAASAGIDAMNRPLQVNAGGVAAKPDRQLTLKA